MGPNNYLRGVPAVAIFGMTYTRLSSFLGPMNLGKHGISEGREIL